MIHPDKKNLSTRVIYFLKNHSPSTIRLKALRIFIFFLSACLVAGIGSVSFLSLRSSELKMLDRVYQSSSDLVSTRISRNLQKKLDAVSVVNRIFGQAIKEGYIGNAPNITLPGFESIMGALCNLASARGVSFNPWVTNESRHEFEAYAASHVDLLHGPESLKKRTNGSWIVADGIYNKTGDHKIVRHPGYNKASKYPNIMLPVWQIAPIALTSKAVMYDVHSGGSRMKVIDEAISTKQGRFTDLVQLVMDTERRPSTVLYTPLISLDDNKTILGVSSASLSWDDALRDSLPSYLSGIHCVISTSTSTFTFLLSNGEVKLLGTGDLHDETFDKYKQIISATIPSLTEFSTIKYTLTLYPTKELYLQYVTDLPVIVTCAIVCSIVLTIILALLYDILMTSRGRALYNAALSAEEMICQTQSELELKGSFVRYISHEIRTPLSTVKMGLELLMQDIQSNATNKELLKTVKDISDSCTTALELVNDFLLFDKIKTGSLVLELSSRNIIKTIDTVVNPFFVQARFAKIDLKIIHNLDPIDIEHNNIHVDIHKFKQVLRNTISNALKFTPNKGHVEIKIRKSKGCVNGQDIDHFVVDVIDSGVGISKENQKKLFKEIIQFDAGTLQKGGGSGLGLYISYGIICQHGGMLSVHSDGVGCGSRFSILIPANYTSNNTFPNSPYIDLRMNRRLPSVFRVENVSERSNDNNSHNNSHKQHSQFLEQEQKLPDPTASTSSDKYNDNPNHYINYPHQLSRIKSGGGNDSDGLQILVVDDSAASRKMICRLLLMLCHKCEEAVDGRDAVEQLKRQQNNNTMGNTTTTSGVYDAIIIDYSMPNMTGPEAVKEIRNMGYVGLVIGVTGYSEGPETDEFTASGTDYVLVKPVEMVVLNNILISRHLMRSNLTI